MRSLLRFFVVMAIALIFSYILVDMLLTKFFNVSQRESRILSSLVGFMICYVAYAWKGIALSVIATQERSHKP